MRPNCILIRYGEIALKGRVTRKNFENILKKNIKTAFQQRRTNFELNIVHGRFILKTDDIKEAINILSHIFGITSISPAYSVQTDIKTIQTRTNQLVQSRIENKTSFALRVNRTGTHSFSSQDIARDVGAYVQQQTDLSVDLTNPDIKVFIEIRGENTYIFFEKISGPGGMPMGSQGNVITLIESAYDLLATWFLLKRGCNIIYACSDKAVIQGTDFFFSIWHIPKHITVFQNDEILWDHINELISQHSCHALCTGTFFSSNSNPLSKINSLKKQTNLPILTPLLSFDKKHIRHLCKEKGIII